MKDIKIYPKAYEEIAQMKEFLTSHNVLFRFEHMFYTAVYDPQYPERHPSGKFSDVPDDIAMLMRLKFGNSVQVE
jgi:hypothetical protein